MRLIEMKIAKTVEQSRFLLGSANFNKEDEVVNGKLQNGEFWIERIVELIEMKIAKTVKQGPFLLSSANFNKERERKLYHTRLPKRLPLSFVRRGGFPCEARS